MLFYITIDEFHRVSKCFQFLGINVGLLRALYIYGTCVSTNVGVVFIYRLVTTADMYVRMCDLIEYEDKYTGSVPSTLIHNLLLAPTLDAILS